MEPIRHSFRAMNTDIRLLLYPSWGGSASENTALLARAEAMVRAHEARFSRFLPASELSLLNQSAGGWVSLSRDMAEVLAAAREMHRQTGGIFEPGMLPRLESAGYDRSFERLPAVGPFAQNTARSSPGLAEAEFDGPRRMRLPAGCRLDLGGIVKGWAADRVADWLAPFGPALADLGGDIALRGALPGGSPWCVGVENPDTPGQLLTALDVMGGGIATSGTNRRRWRAGGDWMHHLIDPRTGYPARTDLVQVVALHESTAQADVWAKTALILGSDGCGRLIEERPDLRLLLISADGSVRATAGVSVSGTRPMVAA